MISYINLKILGVYISRLIWRPVYPFLFITDTNSYFKKYPKPHPASRKLIQNSPRSQGISKVRNTPELHFLMLSVGWKGGDVVAACFAVTWDTGATEAMPKGAWHCTNSAPSKPFSSGPPTGTQPQMHLSLASKLPLRLRDPQILQLQGHQGWRLLPSCPWTCRFCDSEPQT